MNKLRNLLDLIRGGPEAEAFMEQQQPYIKKWSDISQYGDPEGEIVGYDDNDRPIYYGGDIHQTQIQSETSDVFSTSPEGLTREELEEVGVNPNRLGDFDP